MRFVAIGLFLALSSLLLIAQAPPQRIAIRGAMVVEGVGTPNDILIQRNPIAAIVPSGTGPAFQADIEIDGLGRCVLPGFIYLHGHTHDEPAGRPMPVDYCLKLWPASGITTMRDVGSNWDKAKRWRADSAAGLLTAPRLLLYRVFSAQTTEEARRKVEQFHPDGVDGIKFLGTPSDVMKAMSDAAQKLGIRRAHHTGVEETNAWDDIANRTTSIEHWYGISEAARDLDKAANLRDFSSKGGLVGIGQDAGFISRVYGFSYRRELELHQEAGFPPLKVIQHATHNGARILGMEDQIGRLRAGWLADLIVVKGNPLANLVAEADKQ